jgi:predicted ribosome quality control (RQC) complex YloA/Tae2 family protein
MVKQVSGVEISFLLREMEPLVGAKVEKVYNRGEIFYIHLYTGESKVITLWPGKGLYIGNGEHDRTPSNFCMLLRKHLRSSKITKIEQLGLERIVKIHFQKEEDFILVLEVVKPGNLVLVKDGMIVFPLHIRKYGSRWIKPKEEYAPPSPNKKIMDFSGSDKQDIVRFLAVDVGLGGKYSEELCLRSGVKKDIPLREMKKGDAEELEKSLQELVHQKPEPQIIDGELVPTRMKLFSSKKGEAYGSLSEAVRAYLQEEEKGEVVKEDMSISRKISEDVSVFEKKALEARRKAEIIMRDFDAIQTIVRGISQAVESYGWEKTKELLKDYDGFEASRITGIFPDSNTVIIDDDVEIDMGRSLGENMNSYYEEAKKFERKISSAKEKMKSFDEKPKKMRKEIPKRKEGWYDKFHCFESSDGFLVVSGRNAGQNEELVKRYMESGDLVFHADIHGSPFTLIKDGKKSPDKTRAEAAQQTLTYSKAWGAGMGSGDVYYVWPHQIKSQAPSGEYLSRGSFMISGKKNFIKNVKLELAVGFSDRVLSGPKSALRKKTSNYVIVYPGPESREKTAEKIIGILSKGTDYVIPKDEIVRVLPGECMIWNAYE